MEARPVHHDPKVAEIYIDETLCSTVPTLYGMLCEDKEFLESSSYARKITGCFASCLLFEKRATIYKMGLRLMNIILDAYAKNEANAEVFRSEVLHFIEDLPPKLKPRNADSWKDISAKDIMNRIVHLNVNYYFWRQLPEFKHIRAFKLFTRTTDPVVALIKIMTKGYKVKSLKVTVDFWTYFAFAKTKLLK